MWGGGGGGGGGRVLVLAAQQSTMILSILTGVYVSLKHLLQRELGGRRLGLGEDNNNDNIYSNFTVFTVTLQ